MNEIFDRQGLAAARPVGVLALQGSFPLHMRALRRLGVESRAVTRPEHLDGLGALILPGGESTVQSLLARDYGLFEPLRQLARGGLPCFGTCAGAILLGTGAGEPPRLEAAPVELSRNAYGRQIDSFTAPLALAPFESPFHGVFIRSPRIVGIVSGTPTASAVEVLGTHGGDPVLVRAGHIILATFHPELTDDLRLHRYFLEACAAHATR